MRRIIFQCHFAIMGMNDGLAERKPKPKTSAAVANRIAPGKEHFKHMFLQFIGDTETVIADAHFLSALCFDFRYLLCRCAHNPYACIAHTVKKRVKLPPLRVLLWRRFQKKLVYGYIVAEHKLKENL